MKCCFASPDPASYPALSNHQGKLKTRYQYDAFGEVLAGDLSDNPYAFTGQRLDPESGLYHFHFRQYDAEVGVWATADPIGVFGGVNLYQYVNNNPVNHKDRLGLWGVDADEDNDSSSFGSGLESEYDADEDGNDDEEWGGDDDDSSIQWSRIGKGALEVIAGVAGLAVAVASEVSTAGSASLAALSIACASAPALGHGIAEIVAGFMGISKDFPSPTPVSFATLATTKDQAKADKNEAIANSFMLGLSIGKWPVKSPGKIEGAAAGADFADIVGAVTEQKIECEKDNN